jgi:hypothetical protein
MSLPAGEEPTLGEEARASEEPAGSPFRLISRHCRQPEEFENTECAERTADDGRHQLQSLFPIYKSRLSIMAHGAAPLDLRAAGHSQIPHPVRGRAVQNTHDKPIHRAKRQHRGRELPPGPSPHVSDDREGRQPSRE